MLTDNVKVITFIINICIVGLLIFVIPGQNAYAQTCGTQLRLDAFACVNHGDELNPDCRWTNLNTKRVVGCTGDPNDCRTTNRECSSADDESACGPKTTCYPGGDCEYDGCWTDTLKCSHSPCWITGDPAPTPTIPPGADPTGCYGCSSNGGGFCMWHDSCPSWGGNCDACPGGDPAPTPTPAPATVMLGRVQVDINHDGVLYPKHSRRLSYAPVRFALHLPGRLER
jgi:hypothetical protein